MSVALSARLIGSEVLHARWRIIDDHEIFTTKGAGQPLSLSFTRL